MRVDVVRPVLRNERGERVPTPEGGPLARRIERLVVDRRDEALEDRDRVGLGVRVDGAARPLTQDNFLPAPLATPGTVAAFGVRTLVR